MLLQTPKPDVNLCCLSWLLSHCLIGAHRSTSPFTVSKTQTETQAQAELSLTLLGDKDKSEHLIPALCFYPLLSRVFTHTYSTFSLCKVTMSDSIHGHLFSVLVSPALPWGSTHSSPFSSLCFKSLHSNAAQQPAEDFYFFLPPLPPPNLGRQRPTGTYLVSVFIPIACLWPTGKLQTVWSVCKLIEISHSPPHARSHFKAQHQSVFGFKKRRFSRVSCVCVCQSVMP